MYMYSVQVHEPSALLDIDKKQAALLEKANQQRLIHKYHASAQHYINNRRLQLYNKASQGVCG
jgi:hypothetical protein